MVDALDRRGDLALFWKEKVKLEILSFNKHHIDAIIGDITDSNGWHLTGFYGEPETSRCHIS